MFIKADTGLRQYNAVYLQSVPTVSTGVLCALRTYELLRVALMISGDNITAQLCIQTSYSCLLNMRSFLKNIVI
jgi:hypothetical protein